MSAVPTHHTVWCLDDVQSRNLTSCDDFPLVFFILFADLALHKLSGLAVDQKVVTHHASCQSVSGKWF